MTKKTTPHSLHVERKRAEASTSSHPVLRLSGPALLLKTPGSSGAVQLTDGHLTDRTLIVNVRGGKITVMHGTDGSKAGSAPGDIERHIRNDGCIMATDKQSLDGFLRRLERLGDRVSRRLAFQLRGASRLAVSPHLAVLTTLCHRKFWAPTSADVGDLRAWRDVLGVRSGNRGLAEMVEMVGSTAGPLNKGVTLAAWRSIHQASKVVIDMSAYSTDDAAIRCFLAAENVGEGWNAIKTFDPISAHEVATEGSSAKIEPVARDPETAHIIATVSEPCRIKTGRVVHILDPATATKAGEAELFRLSYDPNRGLIGEFRPVVVPGGRSKTSSFAVLDSSLVRPTEFIIAPEPFLGTPAKQSYPTKWAQNKAVPRPAMRDVPMDVAFAGGVDE